MTEVGREKEGGCRREEGGRKVVGVAERKESEERGGRKRGEKGGWRKEEEGRRSEDG